MQKPALIIDMMAPAHAEDDDEAHGDEAPLDAGVASSKADPEAMIADIRAQLDQLEAIVGGLG